MGILSFKGGVHPFDGKSLSKNQPITRMIPTGDMVYPLLQHIGAPAVPIVNPGDRVLAGQKIAEAGSFVSACIHSSVSGTVKAIESHFVANGSKVDSIIIENDELYEEAATISHSDYSNLSNEEIRNIIKEAGVVGMGGAGFPTHVKLAPKNPDEIEYIIVNGAECEPYLTSDYRRMLEEPDKVIEGLKIILKLFQNAKGIIAIEDNKPEVIIKFRKLVQNESGMEVISLKTKYPQGAERQLIYATTGRKINSTMLPADAGCIVDNVDTVVAVYHAVIEGRPLTERFVTVTGDAIIKPQNFLVKMGTNCKLVIEAAGGFHTQPEKVISGGPMMGIAMFQLDVPVTKGTSALLCFLKDEVSESKSGPCINCGRCVSICPGRVMPSKLADFATRGQTELFLKYDGLECCECGCCSYICPAKRNLTQSIKTMRKDILASKKK